MPPAENHMLQKVLLVLAACNCLMIETLGNEISGCRKNRLHLHFDLEVELRREGRRWSSLLTLPASRLFRLTDSLQSQRQSAMLLIPLAYILGHV